MADNVYNEYNAEHLTVERSAVRLLNSQTANLTQSAVQRLTAEAVTAQGSALGTANASTLEMRDSMAGAVIGDYVKVENSSVNVLLAPRVSGNVKAVITLPAAFAFGFGYFFARGLAGKLFTRSQKE